MVVIDADGKILGRMAARAAEQLKNGEEVHIINAEQAVVTGRKEDVFDRYRKKKERGSRDRGPFFPTAPERIVKRTIRGMLPDTDDGKQAFKRLRTYNGNPAELEADAGTDIRSAADVKGKQYVSVNQISSHM